MSGLVGLMVAKSRYYFTISRLGDFDVDKVRSFTRVPILPYVAGFVLVDVLILSVWIGVDPLFVENKYRLHCVSAYAERYVTALVAIKVGAMLYAAILYL